jgi:hypothetical protein
MLQIINNNEIVAEVKSISAAWNKFRELRDSGAHGSLDAVDAETKEIKLAVILKVNTKGKVEFRNRDKEEVKAAKAVKHSAQEYENESESEPSTVELMNEEEQKEKEDEGE